MVKNGQFVIKDKIVFDLGNTLKASNIIKILFLLSCHQIEKQNIKIR
jgi:hypothetical protein